MTSRTRNRTQASFVECKQVVTAASGPPIESFPLSGPITSKFEKITDIVTPNFVQRIKNGEIINNPVSVESYTLDTGGGSYQAIRKTDSRVTNTRSGAVCYYEFCVINGRHIGDYYVVTDDASLIDHAVQQAVANIDRTPYAFGEDLAEIAETIRFLKDPIRSLYNLSHRLSKKATSQKRKWKNRADIASALNDLYLTDRFVLMPLVRSIYDVIDAAKTRRDKPVHTRRTARGYASDSKEQAGEMSYVVVPGVTDYFERYTQAHTSVRAYILYDLVSPRDLAFHLGLRAKDIPITLWQIVPLSFMVDRVYDISGAIRGVTNLSDPRLNILATGYTIKADNHLNIRFVKEVHSLYNVTASGSFSASKSSFGRAVGININVQSTIPVLRPKNLVKDATSIADLAALSASLIYRSYNRGL